MQCQAGGRQAGGQGGHPVDLKPYDRGGRTVAFSPENDRDLIPCAICGSDADLHRPGGGPSRSRAGGSPLCRPVSLLGS